jgi:uncharacterized DUF497 family protein
MAAGKQQRMFDWDDANRRHLAEHGVEPFEAEQVIANDPFDLEEQLRNGEERLLQVGETNALRILVVVTMWRGSKIRVVTAFPATPQLRSLYIAQKGRADEG